ncbi:MAG: MotA/TolQ/ExbB proton channel family protein [Bdellovibrionales bacterium]
MLTEKIFNAAQSGAEGVLWFLIFLSIISVGIMIERYLTLGKYIGRTKKIQKRLNDVLQSNSFDELEDISRDRESLEGRALAYGLRHVKESGKDGLDNIFNSFAIMEKPKLEKSLNFLATVGSNAPFLGLLGTVLGIMKAFNDLATSQGDASAVMTGIAEALVATAVGLFVAMPAVVAYNYFQKKVKVSLSGIEAVKELCIAYASSKKGS